MLPGLFVLGLLVLPGDPLMPPLLPEPPSPSSLGLRSVLLPEDPPVPPLLEPPKPPEPPVLLEPLSLELPAPYPLWLLELLGEPLNPLLSELLDESLIPP